MPNVGAALEAITKATDSHAAIAASAQSAADQLAKDRQPAPPPPAPAPGPT